MNKESSNQSKTKEPDKFYDGKRCLMWPSKSFVELTLSTEQVRIVREWPETDQITPCWLANSTRVLFVNWTILEEWKSRKRKS